MVKNEPIFITQDKNIVPQERVLILLELILQYKYLFFHLSLYLLISFVHIYPTKHLSILLLIKAPLWNLICTNFLQWCLKYIKIKKKQGLKVFHKNVS